MKTSRQRREQRKRAKERLMFTTDCPHGYEYETNCLDCCNIPAVPKTVLPWKCPVPSVKKSKEQKDIDMYASANVINTNQSAKSDTMIQKDYLLKRLDDAEKAVTKKLRTLYGIDEPKGPKTIKEARKLLEAGQFTFPKCWEEDQELDFYDIKSLISWRMTPADEVGYKTAKADLAVKKQAAVDTIWGLNYADGLAAVQAFEALPTTN